MFWCIALQGSNEMMQVTFVADINHDDTKHALVIVDAYPQGTKAQLSMIDKFTLPPETIVTQRIAMFVSPVVAETGKAWTGRIILVDQFKRKYKTDRATFRWVGPPGVPPSNPK